MDLLKPDYLPLNQYIRPGKLLIDRRGIAVHWYENPDQPAMAVKQYWLDQAFRKVYGSAHVTVDDSGGYLLIPLNEEAYHVGSYYYTPLARAKFNSQPNSYLIGIEAAHINWDGEMSKRTEYNLIQICAELCKRFDFLPEYDLYRHWDITFKCTARGPFPRWYVENENRWLNFKKSVEAAMSWENDHGRASNA